MLAAAGDALILTLREHRLVKGKVRAVERLPQLELQELLKRYASDAPAFYWLPGQLRVQDDAAVMTFQLAGVVRNVGGHDKAFRGDGKSLGADHLLVMAIRAIHAQRIGGATWILLTAEMEDDPIFDSAGIAAVSMVFESSPIALPADLQEGDLDDFLHFHADFDLAPHAGEEEYASWLATPPDFTNARPQLQMDVPLEGAS